MKRNPKMFNDNKYRNKFKKNNDNQNWEDLIFIAVRDVYDKHNRLESEPDRGSITIAVGETHGKMINKKSEPDRVQQQ